MNRCLLSLLACAALGSTAVPAFAQASGNVRVDFLGPGGHSSGNYGRTSALHAAGRTAILLQQALPAGSYVMTDLTGGNSVNSIASDGLLQLRLTAANASAYQALLATVSTAAAAGATAENDFRNVRPGDLTGGAPADIRFVVTDGGFGSGKLAPAFVRPANLPRAKSAEDEHGHRHGDGSPE